MNKETVALQLARAHLEIEPSITRVFTIVSPQEDRDPHSPIRLLEVNEATVPSGIMPLYFGPGPTVPFPSVIVEITPDEFDKLTTSELTLPRDWALGSELFPAAAAP